MKIRSKILACFSAVALVGAMVGVIGFVSSSMLSGIATEMHELQIESASISTVLNAHYTWRQNLTSAVLNGSEFTGSLDSATCALGQWESSDAAQNMSDPGLLQMLEQLKAPHDQIHSEAQTVVAYIAAGELDNAKQYLNEEIFPTTQEVIDILTTMEERYEVLLGEKDEETTRIENLVAVINVVMTVIVLAAGTFFALLLANMISKPLKTMSGWILQAGETGNLHYTDEDWALCDKLALGKDEIGQSVKAYGTMMRKFAYYGDVLSTIAHRDLTVEVDTMGDNDTFGNAITQVIDNMNHVFKDINTSSSQVATGATQVADGSQALAQGATEQAASVEELSGSMAEVAERTKHNAELAGKAAQLSDTIRNNAEKGTRQMNEMVGAVKEINEANQSIGQVIKTIDDIAFQTNILALNAAVEAARAGEHGKGFAVVADEVRNLAAKSADAAKNTEGLINSSIQKAEMGEQIAAETAASLSEIVSGVGESSQLITEIAQESDAQSVGISQINTGIDQVAQVVQQNSATAEESAAAAQEMSSQSAMLQQLIGQFRIRDDGTMAVPAQPARKQLGAPGSSGAIF